MLGTLLRRVTVKSLDLVVERGHGSKRAPVRAAAKALHRARGWVGLDVVRRQAPMPAWTGQLPNHPTWESDRKKLEKHRKATGIIPNEETAKAQPVHTVKVYFTRNCPFTRAATQLLNQREIAFEQIDVTGDKERLQWLKTVTKQPTTPQIFIDDKSIGGYTELARLDQSGDLQMLLGRTPEPSPVATKSEEAAKPAKKRLPVVGEHPEHSPFESLADEWEGETPVLEGEALVERVREVLDECRPMVQADGGDIELLDVKADVVHLALTGNCIGCPSATATLRHGIERRLKRRIPQLQGIESDQLR